MPHDDADQIAAYVDGDMTPGEAGRFERRMADDPALRREVDTWREALDSARQWMDAETPGVESVDELAIPHVASRRRMSVRPALVRSLAAAAIFVAGVCVGALPRQSDTTPEPATVAPSPPQATDTERPPQPRPQAPEPQHARMAQATPRRHARTENGRLVVETTLKTSGARALWVVDGTFRLAQAAEIQ
jgi:hypothetical protein